MYTDDEKYILKRLRNYGSSMFSEMTHDLPIGDMALEVQSGTNKYLTVEATQEQIDAIRSLHAKGLIIFECHLHGRIIGEFDDLVVKPRGSLDWLPTYALKRDFVYKKPRGVLAFFDITSEGREVAKQLE